MCLAKKAACEGVLVALQSLLTLKKCARTWKFLSNDPLPKFIRSVLVRKKNNMSCPHRSLHRQQYTQSKSWTYIQLCLFKWKFRFDPERPHIKVKLRVNF
jgi:hypothetical protein